MATTPAAPAAPVSSNSVWQLLAEIGKKSGVSEVIINNAEDIFVEHQGELVKLNAKVKAEDIPLFVKEVADFNNRKFDASHPILDGNLPDGSRINVISKDYTRDHSAITIRKYLKNIKTFESAPGLFGLDPKWIEFFKSLIHAKMNVIVSGGTGVGKTTFLNLMLQEVAQTERVITIEDTRELNFQLPNVVRLEARNSFNKDGVSLNTQDLLKNTLRMRPDRIIVGEVRGGEVFDMLQAMNTGHDGSMCSVHANSSGECLKRLETLYLLAGHDVPLKAIRSQMASAINFLVQIRRNREGQRVVYQIAEVAGIEGETIQLQDIGMFKDEKLQFTGLAPKHFNRLKQAGLRADFFLTN